MARLLPAVLCSRLAFDYRVIRGLRSDHLGPIRAYTSDEAYQAGVFAGDTEGVAGKVRHYVVPYNFPILIGEGKTTPGVEVKFDLLAGQNYPFADPLVTCVGQPRPWSPHVHPASGLFCLGEGWRWACGRMLAAHLVVHVMRLLNCDEPEPGDAYGGWNAAAVRYWRTVLKCQPLNRQLSYPVLPSDITHVIEDPGSMFRSTDQADVLTPAPEGHDLGDFQTLGDTAETLVGEEHDGVLFAEQEVDVGEFRRLGEGADTVGSVGLAADQDDDLGDFRPLGGGS